MTCRFWLSIAKQCKKPAAYHIGQSLVYCSEHGIELEKNLSDEVKSIVNYRKLESGGIE